MQGKQTKKRQSSAGTSAAAKTRAMKPKAKKVQAGAKGRIAAKLAPIAGLERATLASRQALNFAPGLERVVAESARLSERVDRLAGRVVFTVAPKTVSGEPIQAQRGRLDERSIDDFRPDPQCSAIAAERLKQLGFSVIRQGRFSLTVAGDAKLISQAMAVELTLQVRPRRTKVRATQNFAMSFEDPKPEDLYIAPAESLTVKSRVSEAIDDFVFVPPPLFFAPAPVPPAHAWHGVDAARIRQLLKVPTDATGKGVTVGLIDTGFYRHPYYQTAGLDYRPTPTAAAPNPERDDNGHGTAIAYNVFATAPGATVKGFQHTEQPQDALEDAADAGVDILSCSWGWDLEQSFPILEASIRSIIDEGKSVLFASGNGHRAWPGSMPQVLSIGGVYADTGLQFEASNYASGFSSDLYPGRKVPDVSGLVGQRPRAIYIMMPCPPGCAMDRELGGKSFPDRDESGVKDGWVGASGTSSATPQIAGVVALLIQKARANGRSLRQEDIRSILQRSGVPVQRGANALGFPAKGHPNVAVGHGLVDATGALALV